MSPNTRQVERPSRAWRIAMMLRAMRDQYIAVGEGDVTGASELTIGKAIVRVDVASGQIDLRAPRGVTHDWLLIATVCRAITVAIEPIMEATKG